MCIPASRPRRSVMSWSGRRSPARPTAMKRRPMCAALTATGNSTWIAPAVMYAADQLRAWAQRTPNDFHRQALYLYTDGSITSPIVTDWLADVAVYLRDVRRQDAPFLWAAFVRPGNPAPPDCTGAHQDGFNICQSATVAQPPSWVRPITNAHRLRIAVRGDRPHEYAPGSVRRAQPARHTALAEPHLLVGFAGAGRRHHHPQQVECASDH